MIKDKYKLSIRNLLFFLIVVNPLFSLVFDGTKIHYHYIYLPVVVFLVFILLNKNKKDLLLMLGTIIITSVSVFIHLMNNAEIGKINNHFFSFIMFVFLCIYFYHDDNLLNFKDYLKKHKKIIFYIILIINVAELYMIISKRGFINKWNWGGTFFKGTSSMEHTLAYLMLTTIIYSIILSFTTKKKRYLALSLLPFYCVFISGVRIALPLAGILAIIEIEMVFFKDKDSFIIKLLKLAIIAMILFLLFKDRIIESDLIKKIIKRKDSGNDSAGRYQLWGDLLTRFASSPDSWLLGFGDDKVYKYSLLNPLVNVSIWAHNDLIQILVGKGILCFGLYIKGIIRFFKKIFRDNGNIYSYLLMGFVGIAAVLNGFYNYRDICFTIPFLLILNIYLSKKNLEGEKSER